MSSDDDAIESADPTIDHSRLVGRTIAGKFEIERFLGGGAMGAVYLARQTALDKNVAVKVMHARLASDKAFAARFQREAKAASRLDHVNSVRVIDFGEEPDGLLYIAMEYLEGRNLYDVIHQDWPISRVRVIDVLSQALAALAVAHDMGVIHRDLKPENLMILAAKNDEGQLADVVKVCDFGIAKITDRPRDDSATSSGTSSGASGKGTGPSAPTGGKALTTQGMVVGTPEYMSPEQAKGEALDARSDLYSMGIILYQLLVGRVPFQADSAIGIVLKHVTEAPRPPREIYEGVDRQLEAICLKALQKDKGARYQTARELRQDLRAALEGRAIDASAASSGPELVISTAATIAEQAPATLQDASGASGASASTSGGTRPLPAAPHPSGQQSSSKVTPLGTEAAVAPVSVAQKPRSPWMVPLIIMGALGAGIGGALVGVKGLGKAIGAPTAHINVNARDDKTAHDKAHDDKTAQDKARDDNAASPQRTELAPGGTQAMPIADAVNSSGVLATRTVATKLPGGKAPPKAIAIGVDSAAIAPAPPSPTQGVMTAVVSDPAPPPQPALTNPPPPPPTPPAPPPPAAPAFDAAKCAATAGAASASGSVSAKDVHAGGFGGAAQSCYLAALRASGAAWSGSATVRVGFDDSAHFKNVSSSLGAAPGALKSCVEQAAKQTVTLQVRGGDITGEPAVTIPVTFTCP